MGGVSVPLNTSQFTSEVPADGSPLTLEIRNADGGSASRENIELSGSAMSPSEMSACPVVEEGYAILVRGSFDGKRDTTEALIDGSEAGILAESPRECIISTMNSRIGPHELKIRDNGQDYARGFNVASVTVRTPESATIGRKTFIQIEVDGLEGADPAAFPLLVRLESTTPKLLSFGESASLSIAADEVKNGRWTGKLEFKPKKAGTYTLGFQLICDPFHRAAG